MFKNKLKIVVAYENRSLAHAVKSIIEENEEVEKVELAFDGQDVIIKIMNLEPDIVFIDNEMPKRTGLEVIEAVENYPCIEKKPRFVLISADIDVELIRKTQEFDFYIEYKSVDYGKISKYIKNFEPIEIDYEEIKKKSKEDDEIIRRDIKNYRLRE